MKRIAVAVLIVTLTACSKSDPAPNERSAPKAAPEAQREPPAPEPAAVEVPMNAWVRTTGYDGKAFLGFTYMDRVKGPCIKGEFTDGVSDEELSKRLQDFPSNSFEPYPDGHTATPLTAEEIARLKLPTRPDWVASFE